MLYNVYTANDEFVGSWEAVSEADAINKAIEEVGPLVSDSVAFAAPEIELILTEHDDGYRPSDWFARYTIDAAERAKSAEEAHQILLDGYLGPDVDGVHVWWCINGVPFKDHIDDPYKVNLKY